MFRYIRQNRFRIFLGAIYLSSIFGLVMLFYGVHWGWFVAAFLLSKLNQLIGHSIGMHRLFSHRAFTTTPACERLIAWWSVLVGVGSPIQYVLNHRYHHRVADQPRDLHSPQVDGRIRTALGLWQFHGMGWFKTKGFAMPRDLMKSSTHRFINDNYYKIWILMALGALALDWKVAVYCLAMQSFIYHVELNVFVNMIGHSWGKRNFEVADNSRNNMWISWYLLGEGLHNNHHAHPCLYDFAVKAGEFDPSGWVIDRLFAIDGKSTACGKVRIDSKLSRN